MTEAENREAIEARRAYHRKWRQENKEKVKLYNEQYWLRKAEELRKEEDA